MERYFEIWEDGATEYQEHRYDFGVARGNYDDRQRSPLLHSTREARGPLPQDGYHERHPELYDYEEIGYYEAPVHNAKFRLMEPEGKYREGDFGREDELLSTVERDEQHVGVNMDSHATNGLEHLASQNLGRLDDEESYIAFPPPSTVSDDDSEATFFKSETDDSADSEVTFFKSVAGDSADSEITFFKSEADDSDSEITYFKSEADDAPDSEITYFKSEADDSPDSLPDYESSTESVSYPRSTSYGDKESISSEEPRGRDPKPRSRQGSYDSNGSYGSYGTNGTNGSYGSYGTNGSNGNYGSDGSDGSDGSNGYARGESGSDYGDALDQDDYQHARPQSPREMNPQNQLKKSSLYRSSPSPCRGGRGQSDYSSELPRDGHHRRLPRSPRPLRDQSACRNDISSPPPFELSYQAPRTLGQASFNSRHEESASPLRHQNAHPRDTGHTRCVLSNPCESCDLRLSRRRIEHNPEYELTDDNGDGVYSSSYGKFPTSGRRLASPRRRHRDERSLSPPRDNYASAHRRFRTRSPIQRRKSPSISSPCPRSRIPYSLGGGLYTTHPNYVEMEDEEGYEGDMEVDVDDLTSVAEEESVYEDEDLELNDGLGYDDDAFDRYGYDRAEYDRDGVDLHGPDGDDYNHTDDDRHGVDLYGSDGDAHNRAEYGRDGVDLYGSDGDTYNRDGYDRLERNRSELSAERRRDDAVTVSNQRMTQTAYDLDARNEPRYDRYGYDREGYGRRENSSEVYDHRGFRAPSRTRFAYSQNSNGVSENSGPDRGRGNNRGSKRNRSDRSLSPDRAGKPYYSHLSDYRNMNRYGDEIEDVPRYSRLEKKSDWARPVSRNRNHDLDYYQLRVPSPNRQRSLASHNERDPAMEKTLASFSQLLDLSSGRIYTKNFGSTLLNALDAVQMEWQNRARGSDPRSASDSGKKDFKGALRLLIMALEGKEDELNQEDGEQSISS